MLSQSRAHRSRADVYARARTNCRTDGNELEARVDKVGPANKCLNCQFEKVSASTNDVLILIAVQRVRPQKLQNLQTFLSLNESAKES